MHVQRHWVVMWYSVYKDDDNDDNYDDRIMDRVLCPLHGHVLMSKFEHKMGLNQSKFVYILLLYILNSFSAEYFNDHQVSFPSENGEWPISHCLGYYPGTLSCNQVFATHLKTGRL